MELAKAYVQIIPSADGITDSITNVIAQANVFIVNYENHRANTTAEYYKTCEIERAE